MRRPTWLTGPVLSVLLLLGHDARAGAGAGEPLPGDRPYAVETDGQDDPPVDGEAMDILTRMAELLAQAQGFGVTIHGSFDVVQDTGQKIQFGERRAVTLSRPDGLRVEAQESDGKRTVVTFDGKAIDVFDPQQNVYSRIEKTGTVDDAVRYLVQDLQLRLPLALLLVTTLPAELDQRIQALDHVERDILTPVPAEHLAGRTEDVDFQIWVAAEGQPLPQRVLLTYRAEEGEPQYRADFTDWNLAPGVPAAQLAFRPPEGAERIPFMIRVRRAADAPKDEEAAPPAPGPAGHTEGASK